LIAFRIHGVSPEFIEKVESFGYKHPEPDQLIAMRIHGVSPEFISDMQSRGMKNLTIDQLVNLRIHGIDLAAVRLNQFLEVSRRRGAATVPLPMQRYRRQFH
jgi:hypothetical protein